MNSVLKLWNWIRIKLFPKAKYSHHRLSADGMYCYDCECGPYEENGYK